MKNYCPSKTNQRPVSLNGTLLQLSYKFFAGSIVCFVKLTNPASRLYFIGQKGTLTLTDASLGEVNKQFTIFMHQTLQISEGTLKSLVISKIPPAV